VSRYRVLHAPASVGCNPQALSRAMQRLGLDSQSLVVSQNYLSYPADIVLHMPQQNLFFREIKRLWAIFFVLPRFDIVHYNAGTTIASAFAFENKSGAKGLLRKLYAAYLRGLQRIEIAYVKRLGIKMFITFQGDDARQGDYSQKHFDINIANQVKEGYYCRISDDFKRRNIARLCALAQETYSLNPDLLHVLPRSAKFVPYSHVFLDDWVPKYDDKKSRPLRIVHAPSNRRVKGTDLIIESLRRLKDLGYSFELILVEGLSNAEARKVYESADVLVDQLFAGWYGGLAVELMALGKPVLVFIREGDLQFIPCDMRDQLPVIRTTPDTIESDLRKVIEMPRLELIEMGRKSRAYVERWHDPLVIAKMIREDYERALSQGKELT
jgi:glycosyltransferase involved in cell wall biosynthesis